MVPVLKNLHFVKAIQIVQRELLYALIKLVHLQKKIVKDGSDPKYGARPLRRTIQNEIEDPLAEAILAGDIREGMDVAAGVKDGKIIFIEES